MIPRAHKGALTLGSRLGAEIDVVAEELRLQSFSNSLVPQASVVLHAGQPVQTQSGIQTTANTPRWLTLVQIIMQMTVIENGSHDDQHS